MKTVSKFEAAKPHLGTWTEGWPLPVADYHFGVATLSDENTGEIAVYAVGFGSGWAGVYECNNPANSCAGPTTSSACSRKETSSTG